MPIVRAKLREFMRLTWAHLRDDAALYLFIAVYALVGVSILRHYGAWDRSAYGIYVSRGLVMFGFFMPVIALSADFLWTMHRYGKRRYFAYRKVFSVARLARFAAGLCLLQALTVFFGTFTSIKNILPLMHGGFVYDHLHANIDAALHFGVDPWRLIQPFWGNDAMRRLVEWNYNVLWFIVCYGAMFYVATSARTREWRVRYVLGFMLVWVVVGNILAGLFLSAGPAFYGLVTGDPARFADQLAFLARSGKELYSAASYQSYLWMLHDTARTGFGGGISAFPSVHVGLISFNALFLISFRRAFAGPALLYVAFVALSSVYLAWHYAIDAYVAFGAAALIFLAVRYAGRASDRVFGSAGVPTASAAPLPR